MKRVLLFLAQGVEELEASAFTDVFGWTRTYGLEPVKLVTTALRAEVRCAWNFVIKPEALLEEIDPDGIDGIAIPGGLGSKGFYEDACDERLLNLLRFQNERRKPIASVCVGAIPIAKSGILSGRRGTTYFLSEKRRREMQACGVILREEPLIIDGNIITSTSPATALDVAFALLEKVTGPENARKVREGMGFPLLPVLS